jgi:hypothetical protein
MGTEGKGERWKGDRKLVRICTCMQLYTILPYFACMLPCLHAYLLAPIKYPGGELGTPPAPSTGDSTHLHLSNIT